jgi:hypothetical protein
MSHGKTLFGVYLLLYAISTLILLIASTAKAPLPQWGGYVDVSIAILIAVLGFTLFGMNKMSLQYETNHRVTLYLLPIILLGMWYFRNLIDFNVLLPGLAWRTFFFLHILPYGLNLWKIESNS